MKIGRVLCLLFTVVPLWACDNSNDSSESFSGTAFVSVDAVPRVIDIGDAMTIDISIKDISKELFFLKVRYPSELRYLKGTSTLLVDDEPLLREPDVEFEQRREGLSYLVYFLDIEEAGGEESMAISLDLFGEDRFSEGLVEVDADVDDLNQDNVIEISSENPQFDEEDSEEIRVE